MAYTTDEWLVQVRGSIAGGEIFVHTWCFLDVTGGQDIDDLRAIVMNFYTDLTSSGLLHSSFVARGATAKNLSTEVTEELTWTNQVGSGSGDPLPTQCAVRVSLTGTGGVNGGPFLCGFPASILQNEGMVAALTVDDIVDALETFTAALTAGGYQLRINRATANQTVAVVQGRVGERIDVIRKRANDIGEGYTTFSVS